MQCHVDMLLLEFNFKLTNYNIKYTLLILLGQGTVTISVNQLLLDLTLNPKDINAKPIL